MAEDKRYEELERPEEFVKKNRKLLLFLYNYSLDWKGKKHVHASDFSGVELKDIKKLSFHSMRLKHLPDKFGDELSNLVELDLFNNMLTRLPDSMSNLRHLESLNLNRNKLACFPLVITKMSSLRELVLSGNSIRRLPNDLDDLRLLETLDLSSNCLNESSNSCDILNGLKSLGELRKLDIGNHEGARPWFFNQFWNLPLSNLKQPELLTELCMRGTMLSSVNKFIVHFVNLIKLDVGENAIQWLHGDIVSLSKLKVLLIDRNFLRSLPKNIGHLTSLNELKADGNRIATLPRSLRKSKSLCYLDLYNNELESSVFKSLRYMKKLCGLDIDHNNFVISDLQIGPSKYEALRNSLRDHYQIEERSSLFESKFQENYEESVDSDTEPSKSIPVEEYRNTLNDSLSEENWDISDNSDDEYDPNCEPKKSYQKKMESYLVHLVSRKFEFCPADLHSISIKEEMALKRQRGEIQDEHQLVEGQFEDA